MLADLQVMREQEEDAAAAQHVAAAVEKTKVKGLSKVCMLLTHSHAWHQGLDMHMGAVVSLESDSMFAHTRH